VVIPTKQSFEKIEKTVKVVPCNWIDTKSVFILLHGDDQHFTRSAFETEDHKSVKKTDNLTVFFALLGSVLVKAGCRMLMKFTPETTLSGGSLH